MLAARPTGAVVSPVLGGALLQLDTLLDELGPLARATSARKDLDHDHASTLHITAV
jgi:hypothetical protein